MEEEVAPASYSLTLRRRASGIASLFETYWRKRWFRLLSWAFAAFMFAFFLLWVFVIRNLPSVDQLRNYQPALPTYVRTVDGAPIHSFSRERRVQLKFQEYPQMLISAFISAEDKTFFTHGGIDFAGIVAAVFTNIFNDKTVGASTITQQVAKNLLLTNERTYTRKIKEIILARRIEQTLSKEQILELYLNQIFLGRNAYGVQAASRAYFNKDVGELSLHEAAYLAILPKAPSNYTPERHAERALDRRNWVLKAMQDNEYITADQRSSASALPLSAVPRLADSEEGPTGYFIEEVRRELIERFGEEQDNGRNPYSVYGGGLWVRTSYDPVLQGYMEEALRDGLMRYDGGGRWSGPIKKLDPSDGWPVRLSAANLGGGYPDWKPALVLSKGATSAQIGFSDGKTSILNSWAAVMPKRREGGTAFSHIKAGDVIIVKSDGANWILKSVPEVSGGMAAQDPRTGRVLAMQGGFDSRIQSYNRATQAWRQPGSSFKPFVYASALNFGMTPASIIVDGPFCVYQSAKLGRKCFKNFGGGGAGPQTMRWGLEQSRNLMTVRAASQTGMDNVVKLADSAGINKQGEPYLPVLAVSLGSGESTVVRMVNAYSILSQNGRAITPTIIDYVQDRNGKLRHKADNRPCPKCNQADWDGKPMPRPVTKIKQAIDAQSSYQVVNMLEGVIQRGTAKQLMKLGRPIFGKTGTTTGPTNVWFVGGSADMTAGVYLGFDQPRPMGHYAQGGTMAVPIFYDFAKEAMKDAPVIPFRAPLGMRMVRIDRSSGKRVFGAWPGTDPLSSVIWEAFKAESEPRRSIRRDELKPATKAVAKKSSGQSKATRRDDANRATTTRDSDFLQQEGGIY